MNMKMDVVAGTIITSIHNAVADTTIITSIKAAAAAHWVRKRNRCCS